MKRNYKSFGLLIAFILITTFSGVYLYMRNTRMIPDDIVVNGQVDLRNEALKDIIYLDGQWDFYPNVFIDPQDDFDDYESFKNQIQVPGNVMTSDVTPSEFGTYRIKLLVDDGAYGFRFKTVRYAYDVYLNGHKAASLGKVSTHKELVEGDSRFKIAIGNAENNELQLVMHVSAAQFDAQGIISSVCFGTKDAIFAVNLKNKLIEISFVIALITLGMYYIFTYVNRQDSMFLLYFGIMSISAAGILSLMSEQVLRDIINMSYETRSVLQVLIFWVFIASVYYFVSKLYHQWANEKITMAINVYLLGVEAIYLITFSLYGNNHRFKYFFMNPSFLFVIGLLLSMIHIIYIVYNAYKNEVKGFYYSTTILLLVISYAMIIVAKYFYSIDLGYIQQIYFTFFIIFSILLLNEYYNNDLHFAQEISRSINISNKNRELFFKSLVQNVGTPLKSNVKDMEALMSDDSFDAQEEFVSKFSQVRNQTQEIIYMLEDIDRLISDEKTYELRLVNVNLQKQIGEGLAIFIASNEIGQREMLNEFNIDVNVRLDVTSFSTVLYQLLKNALENTKDDGRIILRGNTIDDYVYLYVEDNGRGIAAQDLPFVFDDFYKVDDSNPERFGLGLTLAKETIENHGGVITIKSTLGAGTRVSVGLPINVEDSVVEQEEKFEVAGINEFNVMLVSENMHIVNFLKEVYPNCINYEYASNSYSKLSQSITEHKIDVLILDYNLPSILQENISKQLREEFDSYHLPILMIAPQQIILDMWFHQKIVANDFIASPLDYRNLVLKINNLYHSKVAVESGIKKEFRYLHSQISPHFLYNTLNTIIGLSYVGVEKARLGLQSLAVYLRAKMDIFDSDILIPIDKELETIESYLSIEKLRFGDNVDIIYNVDKTLNFRVPALFIQNLVENSFKHAFVLSEENNKLEITIKNENNINCIIIEDNGQGMDEETIQSIFDQKTGGFGYRNTLERLTLIKDSKITIDSIKDVGTTIKITIPEVHP